MLYDDDTYPVQIRAGGNHTLVLFNDGRACVTGDDADGRCGTMKLRDREKEQKQDQPNTTEAGGASDSTVPCPAEGKKFKALSVTSGLDPEKKDIINRFACVAATWSASFVVDAQTRRNIYAFGTGSKGELGLGPGHTQSHRPTRVSRVNADVPTTNAQHLSFPPPELYITAVASGMGHIAVLLSNGDVYGWGQSRKGQLGSALIEAKIVWEPRKIIGLPFIPDDVACGKDFTMVASKQTGQVCVLGTNRWQIASIPDSLGSMPLENRICSVQASWHGAYVLCEDGSLMAWGRNDRGQIPPDRHLPKIRRMAIGSEHIMLLTDKGEVLACGWGEHGNCGTDVDDRGDVKERLAKVHLDMNRSENEEIIDVGAGCATSWIVTRARKKRYAKNP